MEIDRDLVERITREVVGRLQGNLANPLVESGRVSGGILAVLTGGYVGIDEAVTQLTELRARYGSLTVYLTRCADGRAGDEMTRRVQPNVVLRESAGAGIDQALAGIGVVVYPVCTMTTAAKMGLLIADSPASGIAISALVRRLPVVVATNSMLASITRGDYLPPEFQAVGAEHVARLSKVGVRTCDIRELAATCLGGGHAGATASPTAVASASAPLASSAAASGASWAGSAAVECAPVLNNLQQFITSALADDPSCAPCAAKVKTAMEQCFEAGACRIGTLGAADPKSHGTSSKVAGMIDHTLLKPTATPQDVEKLCAEAREYGFKSVCVNAGYASLAKRLLKGSPVLVCIVVGFPLGATTSATKAAETRDAVADGADEIDMVINIGALKAGEYDKVKHDIEAVVEAAKGRTVKVIFETHLLTDEEKVVACQLSKAGGAHFVKTSTGFSGGGATVEDIALMRKVVGPGYGVKASGGVRTTEDAQKMIAAGANRIGASASISIATGKKSESKGY